MRSVIAAVLLVLVGIESVRGEEIETARKNGILAQEALTRSRDVVNAYLLRRDPVTGLLPRNEKTPTWYVRDSGADLYPFCVMAAYFTDRPVYTGPMQDILRAEIQHSIRVGKLSDNVLAGGGFEEVEIDMDRIIFGSTEYAKDGQLPLTELLGHTAWFARMVGIADELIARAPYDSQFGKLPSPQRIP